MTAVAHDRFDSVLGFSRGHGPVSAAELEREREREYWTAAWDSATAWDRDGMVALAAVIAAHRGTRTVPERIYDEWCARAVCLHIQNNRRRFEDIALGLGTKDLAQVAVNKLTLDAVALAPAELGETARANVSPGAVRGLVPALALGATDLVKGLFGSHYAANMMRSGPDRRLRKLMPVTVNRNLDLLRDCDEAACAQIARLAYVESKSVALFDSLDASTDFADQVSTLLRGELEHDELDYITTGKVSLR